MLDSSPLLTVRELAAKLRISLATAYALLKKGRIASIRIGEQRGAIRIREADIEAYLASSTLAPLPIQDSSRPVRVQLKHLKLK